MGLPPTAHQHVLVPAAHHCTEEGYCAYLLAAALKEDFLKFFNTGDQRLLFEETGLFGAGTGVGGRDGTDQSESELVKAVRAVDLVVPILSVAAIDTRLSSRSISALDKGVRTIAADVGSNQIREGHQSGDQNAFFRETGNDQVLVLVLGFAHINSTFATTLISELDFARVRVAVTTATATDLCSIKSTSNDAPNNLANELALGRGELLFRRLRRGQAVAPRSEALAALVDSSQVPQLDQAAEGPRL